ncbi:MAG: hypothetical protein H0W62_01315 [Chitinophagales bacterium]|nr:hypothetical protein [Chitinophagales bacterium]
MAQQQDLGAWIGSANYFGDLNTSTNFRFINPAGGIFYRYNIDDRISVRANLGGGRIWASDNYSENYYERNRNLSFFSPILETSAGFEFNFLQFNTNDYRHPFTPYVMAGFGGFYFNPSVKYQGVVYHLQNLGTEGQGYPEYPAITPYHRVSSTFIVGGGFKYRLQHSLGLQLEAAVRKTSTDYLDDVSGVYADPAVLLHEGGPVAAHLADPSVEVIDNPIGVPGKMRGDVSKNDNYLFIGIGIFYTLNPSKCPSPEGR